MLAMHGGQAGGLGPQSDLAQSLSHGVDDDGGFASAEAFDGQLGSLVGVFGRAPETYDDAIFRQVRADSLTDGARLREGEGWQRRDEDDGVGFVGERFEDLAGDGGRESEGLVAALLQKLHEHMRGQFISLIAGGDADNGEVFLHGEARSVVG